MSSGSVTRVAVMARRRFSLRDTFDNRIVRGSHRLAGWLGLTFIGSIFDAARWASSSNFQIHRSWEREVSV